MSIGEGSGVMPDPQKPSDPGAARANARERARELRELHQKQDRRRRHVIQALVAFGTVFILAVVTLVLVRTHNNAGPGPQNMLSDGIKIGEGLRAVPTAGLKSEEMPVPSATNAPGVVDIQLYVDYLCANCGTFQQKNGKQLTQWIDSGVATLEIHPIAILTTKSAGTQYSLRAANAAACVAQYAPDQFFAFHTALLTDQPKEGSAGLSDDELLARAKSSGVASLGALKTCMSDRTFKTWVQSATARALAGPIPNSNVSAIAGQLTIIVNGAQFDYATLDPNEFAQFVVQAAGETFANDSTPTPTPTPSGGAKPPVAPSGAPTAGTGD